MAKIGRPPIYTEEQQREIGEKIFALLREGKTLVNACKEIGVARITFLQWTDKDEVLYDRYVKARDEMIAYWASEVVTIADEDPTFTDASGVAKVDGAGVQRNRLRVDSRKWLLSKLKPERYGERITQEHVGANGGPINFNNMNFKGLSDKELDVLQKLLEKADKSATSFVQPCLSVSSRKRRRVERRRRCTTSCSSAGRSSSPA
ncbi:MAG: hypothetical protein VKL39_23110 [Leptolyngbyaceae bacterium]|nr:hypothetical protein [Leptolyngbyaceae bacterium]